MKLSPLGQVALLSIATRAVEAIPTTLKPRQTQPFTVPSYGNTANGHSGPARGWNTYGLQTADPTLQGTAGWAFNDYHFRQQCSLVVVRSGADYVCSIDSQWSVGDKGDDNGIIMPNTTVLPDISDTANYIHSLGMKFGIYLVPGAFNVDSNKYVYNTNIQIGSLFNDSDPSANGRQNWDYGKNGVQQWHDSVIARLASWGVDFIKLDYITPGSPDNSSPLPYSTSGTVAAYHQAIKNNNANIRLDISWKLDRSEPNWGVWQSSADSLRVDQDINNSGEDTFTAWSTVLRTLDNYRQFINEQTSDSTRQGKPIMIHPDMDNTYIGNPKSISGLTDQQRYTMAIHWIGAGANLITGSDQTQRDELGYQLMYNDEAMAVADFTAQYPMQPRNPEGWGTPGGNAAMQLQAWIAGPNQNGTAVVILANYGPDPCLGGGCTPTYGLNWGDQHNVSISTADLGLGSGTWGVRRVWGGGGSGGADHTGGWQTTDAMACWLGPGESALYVLTPSK